MNIRLIATGFATVLFAAGHAPAQDSHSAHAGHGSPEKVGTVNFTNSCAPAVQADLASGVAMLHSFWYSAGSKKFNDVLAKDPGCAIADWGIAALLMSNPLAGVGSTPPDAMVAQKAIDAGRVIGAKTQRERDYIDAVAAYYQDWTTTPEHTRQQRRASAFETLAARYPGDDEAQIFSALYIAGTQSQSDQTYAAYLKSADILEKQQIKYPDHPGISHYLIHVYDAPPLAARGLTAARRYAGLAPDAPHALHMPSHIFSRVGAWEESVVTNQRSFNAAIPGNELGEAYHASDYMVYADLQLGRDAAALAAMQAAMKLVIPGPLPPPAAYASSAMPARYAVERADWEAASKLVPPKGGVPFTEALVWFAHSVGAARIGDVAAARQGAAELETRHAALVAAKNTYWATEVAIQQREVAAWIAYAEKNPTLGLKLAREAADMEDRNEKHIVTPGRILPARELLGDMLFESGQPALALVEYEQSQNREPNRFRGIYGAARAAEAAGDQAKAKAYYVRLLEMAKTADSPRPELIQAKAYVSR
jgi:tetratricopeptide (TPR) repeat protein